MSKLKLQFPLSWPRRDNGSLFPALLVLVLALMAVLQSVLTTRPELSLTLAPPATVTRAKAPEARLAIAPDVILARNLFAPTRTGSAGSVDGALGGAVIAGTVKVANGRYAIVVMPGGSVRRIYPGATLNGWRLVKLGSEQALFARSSERLNVIYGGRAAAAPEATESEEGQ